MTVIETLPEKTLEVYKFIKDYLKENLKPPSVREIARALRFASTSSVYYHLKKLESAGFIELEKNQSRNIRILSPVRTLPEEALLPLIGNIKAGIPALAEENIEAYIEVPPQLKAQADFVLKVSGDSMKDAGILDGDLVLIKSTPTINPGEIGAFLVDGEATIKRFEIIKGKPALVPANPDYSIIYPLELKVIGKAVFLIRKL